MNGEGELYNIQLSPEDVRKAAENVTIETDSSTKDIAKSVVGAGNTIVNSYMERTEGVGVRDAINEGVVRVVDDLGGALGTYETAGRNAGRTSLLRKYLINPVHATGIYVHEAVHKTLDRVFGYERRLKNSAERAYQVDPILGILTMKYGNALNEGLTDLVRLRAVGENGIVSAYQRNGFVGAAAYALKRSGGKIKNLVNRLPEAIGDFVSALKNPQLAYQS